MLKVGFKERYNATLERFKKGEKFLDNHTTSQEEVEKWLPLLDKIIKDLSIMINEYEQETGKKFPEGATINGL